MGKITTLLISENRPEWMISDLSIMLSDWKNAVLRKSIIIKNPTNRFLADRYKSVPAYTTYTERDYEYIIDDCTPTVLIISDKNFTIFKKLETT